MCSTAVRMKKKANKPTHNVYPSLNMVYFEESKGEEEFLQAWESVDDHNYESFLPKSERIQFSEDFYANLDRNYDGDFEKNPGFCSDWASNFEAIKFEQTNAGIKDFTEETKEFKKPVKKPRTVIPVPVVPLDPEEEKKMSCATSLVLDILECTTQSYKTAQNSAKLLAYKIYETIEDFHLKQSLPKMEFFTHFLIILQSKKDFRGKLQVEEIEKIELFLKENQGLVDLVERILEFNEKEQQ